MARQEKAGKETTAEEKEKITRALSALKGHTRKNKGDKRKCRWDEAASRIRFEAGGARCMRDFGQAKKYAAENNYELAE